MAFSWKGSADKMSARAARALGWIRPQVLDGLLGRAGPGHFFPGGRERRLLGPEILFDTGPLRRGAVCLFLQPGALAGNLVQAPRGSLQLGLRYALGPPHFLRLSLETLGGPGNGVQAGFRQRHLLAGSAGGLGLLLLQATGLAQGRLQVGQLGPDCG
jgi:hypothetical protein